ncbi:MAG: hypothetical protein C5B47_08270 [Verrucomicrobia bacterium]|nr:MAG: hypothetical protein C5B47_08270 [Verrucomicrobiota bacterium]
MDSKAQSPISLDSSLAKCDFQRILLIKPSALGDVVHTIPLLVKLRSRFPSARIDWMLTPENAELLRCHPALSGIVLFQRKRFSGFGMNWAASFSALRLLWQIYKTHYDLIIDMHGQLRSALFTLASRAPVRIGFDRPTPNLSWEKIPVAEGGRGWNGAREGSWMAYTHRLRITTLDVHAIDRYLWVGRFLGFDETNPDTTLYLPREAEHDIESLLASYQLGKPLILLVPGAMWETKRWPPRRFAEVGQYFHEKGYSVIAAGTKNERSICEEVSGHCPQILNFAGKTPTPAYLAALIRKAALCITNDSASMHLAVALKRPVVSIFGPTNPVCVGPYKNPEAVVRANVPCSPCNFRKLTQCHQGHICVWDVTSQMVIERARIVCNAANEAHFFGG